MATTPTKTELARIQVAQGTATLYALEKLITTLAGKPDAYPYALLTRDMDRLRDAVKVWQNRVDVPDLWSGNAQTPSTLLQLK